MVADVQSAVSVRHNVASWARVELWEEADDVGVWDHGEGNKRKGREAKVQLKKGKAWRDLL